MTAHNPEQDPRELEWMLEYVRGAKSILEIGSRRGITLFNMALVAQPKARICSIDDGSQGGILSQTIQVLKNFEYDAHLLISDSHLEAARDWARGLGPFDFVFIDGDHSYEGVKRDWEWYGPLGKVVGFHDIVGCGGVTQLWNEITTRRRTAETRIAATWMGIGVVWNEDGV